MSRLEKETGVRRMSEAEIRAFLTFGTRTGKLAVTRLDGSPMVVPIWFAVDDDGTLLFTTWGESIKGKSLRRDGRVSLCVDEEQPPYAYVRVDGTASLLDDPGLLRTWATRIGGRYMGAALAEQYGARNSASGELLVRMTPTRIVAEADIAG
jgi:PPOX class probable F420-dependent enzyme